MNQQKFTFQRKRKVDADETRKKLGKNDFKTNEKNSLMLVLPDNTVAICGSSEFEKARGKTDHTFTFSKYEKLNR